MTKVKITNIIHKYTNKNNEIITVKAKLITGDFYVSNHKRYENIIIYGGKFKIGNKVYQLFNINFQGEVILDTKNITNMNGMFYGSNFNQSLDINTRNVTDMSWMFAHNEFNQQLIWQIA